MTTVLIFAREEVVTALLGLLAELCGYQPVYAQSAETAVDACARLACTRIVIDCDHWGCSAKTLGVLQKAGARIILFSPSRLPSEVVQHTAGAPDIRAFTLPIGPEAFGKLLL